MFTLQIKSCQQIWGCVNQPFILFIHHIWRETVLFIIQTSNRMHYFTVFQDVLRKYSGRLNYRGLLAKLLKKSSKITYKKKNKQKKQPVGSQLWLLWVWMNINRVTLQHNKDFIMLTLLFNGFIMMSKLKKRLIRAGYSGVPLQAMFMKNWKQTTQRLQLQERLLTINKRNIIRLNIFRDDNFHSRRQVLKCL